MMRRGFFLKVDVKCRDINFSLKGGPHQNLICAVLLATVGLSYVCPGTRSCSCSYSCS